MSAPILQFKRGNYDNLDFGLRAGEPALTLDTFDLFVGINSIFEDNKFFGSHRYWEREDGDTALRLRLVDKTGNVENSIHLKSPDTHTGITTYTLPETPIDGFFLKTNASGSLEWASVTENASFQNTTFTGVSTFSGLIDANSGLDVTGGSNFAGGSTFDNINVTGVGTITTADINGGNIDGTVIGASSAAAGTFTELAYDNSATSGISTVGELYVGTTQVLYDDGGLITLAGINTVDATTIATLEALLSLDPNDFSSLNISGIATIGGILDAEGGLNVTGLAELEDLNVTGVATFSQAIDADILGNAGTATSLSDARDFSVSGDVATSVSVPFDGTANVDLVVTLSETFSANTSGIITATGGFVGDLTGVASTATRATQVDTTETGDNVEYYPTFVSNSASTQSQTVRTDGGISYNPDSNTLTVPNIKTENLKHSNGTQSIAIDASGNVGLSTNLTVAGNLFVNGSTTSVNTNTLKVKDSLIDIGKIDDGSGNLVPPTSDLNIDIGVLFNYFADAASRKAAVYWDDSEGRIAVASRVTEAASVLTAQAYAALEVGGLWVNNACTAGASEIISCFGGTELEVRNVLIDAGTF